jgi:hypothetical protein
MHPSIRRRMKVSAGIAVGLAAMLAFAAPVGAKTKTLYSQMSKPVAAGASSQDFETAREAYTSTAADDFKVPGSVKSWKLTAVGFAGKYDTLGSSTAGPADSFNLAFYRNAKSLPATSIAQLDAQSYKEKNGEFSIKLSKAVKLDPGHYWVSIQARQDGNTSGQFFWLGTEKKHGTASAFENPGNGYASGCTDWTTATSCFSAAARDFRFSLTGTAAKKPHHR